MNFLIFLRIYSTPKCYLFSIHWKCYKNENDNAIQWVLTDSNSSRFIIYVPSFIFDKLFFEKTPLNLEIFVFQI